MKVRLFDPGSPANAEDDGPERAMNMKTQEQEVPPLRHTRVAGIQDKKRHKHLSVDAPNTLRPP